MIYSWTSEITVVFIENVIFPYAETLRDRALDHVQRRVRLPSKEGLAIHSYWKAILTAIFTDQGAGHNPAKSELDRKQMGALWSS